jgi:polyisoprenoid-binding protein YceI
MSNCREPDRRAPARTSARSIQSVKGVDPQAISPRVTVDAVQRLPMKSNRAHALIRTAGTHPQPRALETLMSNPTTTDLASLTGSWILDPNRTVIQFQTSIMRVIKVNGTFRALQGRASVDPDGAFNGSVVVDTASIDTKIAKRDTHLRGPDFFDVENYPRMTFTATNGLLTSAGQVVLIGNLEIHGQARPVTMRAEISNVGDSQKFSSKFHIDRRNWGMAYAALMRSSTNIHVDITAHFNRA